jgi:hypothetical protein
MMKRYPEQPFDKRADMVERKFKLIHRRIKDAGDTEALNYLDVVINGAFARFRGIKPCGRPTPAAIDATLNRIVAEGDGGA